MTSASLERLLSQSSTSASLESILSQSSTSAASVGSKALTSAATLESFLAVESLSHTHASYDAKAIASAESKASI